MKEKIKKILKNRIFLCASTALIFGTIGVSAATYFPSNNVTYDNTQSGLSSTDVQGAIDELYNACKTSETPPTLVGGDGLLNSVPIVTSGDGLYKDEYEYGRYFYKGSNPKNYITFDGKSAGWRIISIESDKTIKIVSNNIIGSQSWNMSGYNIWSNASLNQYLNSTYYNGLSNTAQNQIVSNNFSVGEVGQDHINMSGQVGQENDTKWNGKVGLVTVSEYIRTNSNKQYCGTFELYNKNYSYRKCTSTGWLDNGSEWWTITPYADTNDNAFLVNAYGPIYGGYDRGVYYEAGVRPVVYLSSSVKITGGDGSQSNPYTLS